MIKEIVGYSYNDVTIVPSKISEVSSRSECNPFIMDHFLPIFASPMASVVNLENELKFVENGIIPIIPRNIANLEKNREQTLNCINDGLWVALSLKDFKELFITNAKDRISIPKRNYYIVVDIANGHMKSLYQKCIEAKKLADTNGYKLYIMTGNIANPKTYQWICDNAVYLTKENKLCCAIDYIRVGVGGGSGCITTSNVSIHYPQASLIDECYKIKIALESAYNEDRIDGYSTELTKSYEYELPKIVADGGIRNYDHVIKALALGADYVMIGSVFSKCIESAGLKVSKNLGDHKKLKFPIERYRDLEIDANGNWWGYYTDEFIYQSLTAWRDALVNSPDKDHAQKSYDERLESLKEKKFIGTIDVKFFGMASSDGQKSIDGEKKKTAEGITKYLPVEYTLSKWTENMISYLRSAMSYTNCKDIFEFIGKPHLIVNSISEIQAVNK